MNKTELAKKLNISRNHLYRIIKNLDFNKKDYSSEDLKYLEEYLNRKASIKYDKEKNIHRQLINLENQNNYLKNQNIYFMKKIDDKDVEMKNTKDIIIQKDKEIFELRNKLEEYKNEELDRFKNENKKIKNEKESTQSNKIKKWWKIFN